MKHIFLFCILITMVSCDEKKIYRFEIGQGSGFLVNNPVSINLSDIEFESFELLHQGEPISYQIDSLAGKIWFLHENDRTNTYVIQSGVVAKDATKALSATKKTGDLQLSIANEPLITYRYGMHVPPIEDIFENAGHPIPKTKVPLDSLFKKSGYLHPIMTPKGDTLTRINPIDHLHHYGLWGPWTHTRIDTTRVDFWNLGELQGTVLFKEFDAIASGPIFSGFSAAQEHIDLKTKERPQVALNEDLQIRMWSLNRPDRYMFDYTSTFSSPLENGILLEAYRYGGGIGLRFHERWHKDNCEVLTSEGKTRLEADGTSARWCIVSGESSGGEGNNGILFMSHPENRMHPEPMRIWPVNANGGRGDMFFEFCPIRHEEWKIESRKPYQLKYSMVVFDGKLTAEEAEAYWQLFAKRPEIELNSS